MLVIKVPKPEPQALNKDRKIGQLLEAQVKHMHAVEQTLGKKHHHEKRPEEITTEAEAAEYIRHVTEKIIGRTKPVKKLAAKLAFAPASVYKPKAKAAETVHKPKAKKSSAKKSKGKKATAKAQGR